MCTTQLYHALRQESLLSDQVVWEDLEKLWKLQGNSAFFVGDPPTNREAYFKNYCLSTGVSASNWAKTKRKGKINVNKENRRNLKYHGWVSLMLERRLAPTGERLAWSSDLNDGILSEGHRQETLDGKGHLRPDVQKRTGNETISSHHPEKKRSLTSQADATTLSPTHLISKLASELHREVSDTTFNYFTMHKTTWLLLTELKEEFTRLVGTSFLRNIPTEDKLPHVVGYIFVTAAGRTGLGDDEVTEPVLYFMTSSAKVLHAFLEAGHGSTIKEDEKTKVEPEEVVDLEFDGHDQWAMEKLMADIKKLSTSYGSEGSNEQGCPMQ